MKTSRLIGVMVLAMFLGVLIQSTLLVSWSNRMRVDVVTILTISFGLVFGFGQGVLAGLLGGLFVDLLSGGLIGLGILTRIAIGLFSGLMGRRLFSENLLVPFAVGAILVVVEQGLYLLGARAFGVMLPIGQGMGRLMLASLFYNGFLTAICFICLHLVNKKLGNG